MFVTPKSSRASSRNSAGVRMGLSTTLKRAREGGIDWKILVSSVVLPVPASPVSTTKPLRLKTEYVSPASASRWADVRKRNAGSGVMLNGSLLNPKN